MTRAPSGRTAWRYRAVVWLGALLLAAGSSSCAPAVTPASLDTPYEGAVGAYYALLADEIDAEAARAAIDQALAVDPSDDALRMVSAQVELHDYVRSGSPAARARLIGQLVAVDASLRSGAGAVDWVEARLFVTFGDLLMIDAQRDHDRWFERTDASVEDLWLALLRFDAADAAYRFARSRGGAEPSRGLVRERDQAATAQVSSRLAVVATISDIPRSPEGALGRLREEALAFLETSLQADVGAEVPAPLPLRAAIVLDGGVHVLRAAAFEALALEASQGLTVVCRATADREGRAAALDLLAERLWWAAHHAAVAGTLGAAYDAAALLGFLEDAATRDPERACEL
jgi:hypothetical protein